MGYGSQDQQRIESEQFEFYREKGIGIVQTVKPIIYWDDFNRHLAPYTESFTGVNTGTESVVAVQQAGGWYQLASGTTAASTATRSPLHPLVGNPLTKNWYFAVRGKIVTVPDAQALNVWGLIDDGSDTITLGSIGADSTADFVLSYNGALGAGSHISLGIPLDTAIHVFEMWSNEDGVLKARMDGGLLKTVNLTTASAYGSLFMRAGNGTTAAAQTTQTDWVVCVAERA
jgi:hypothetical protein